MRNLVVFRFYHDHDEKSHGFYHDDDQKFYQDHDDDDADENIFYSVYILGLYENGDSDWEMTDCGNFKREGTLLFWTGHEKEDEANL